MNLDKLRLDLIPAALRECPQWVLWQTQERDGKATKLPIQADGQMAKSNDPATWTDFDTVCERQAVMDAAGIGFMFSEGDPFCGIDLDGCRDPETGKVAEWAKEIIRKFASYAEVSPSRTGVKIFCEGQSPFATGRKLALKDVAKVCDKEPAIEVYDRLRYFAVTGWRVTGPHEPTAAGLALAWLKSKYWPDEPAPAPRQDFHSDQAVYERARKYLAKLPPSVSGQGGHNAAFHAACVLVAGFDLPEAAALELMREFNAGCNPKWSERELLHKVKQAGKQPGQKGYLRNAAPSNWQRITVPQYSEPLPKPEPKQTTLVEAARSYLAHIQQGGSKLVSLSVPEVDYALSGGVAFGEMVIFAARPSHGKSSFALQCLHNWTIEGLPCAMVSEEMSKLMLGKRTLQFLSTMPEEHWEHAIPGLEADLDRYAKDRAPAIVLEECGATEVACEAIQRAVRQDGVRCVAIDYAQLLRAPGRDRYQQVTNTSIMLRQLANETKVVLVVLAQLNRGAEARPGAYWPVSSDLKDSGQLEQDADVIALLCWPHKIDQEKPLNHYQVFIGKNRNRAIRDACVDCRFLPDRQMILDSVPETPKFAQPSWTAQAARQDEIPD